MTALRPTAPALDYAGNRTHPLTRPDRPCALRPRSSSGFRHLETRLSAGACSLDETGEIPPAGDVTGQTELANLATALTAAGATLTDVVTTVCAASPDREDLLDAWNVVSHAFGDHDVPSTLLGVAVFGHPICS